MQLPGVHSIWFAAVARLLALSAATSVAGAQGGGVSLAGIGHDKGGGTARVFIVEFGDFGCSYCAKFAGETEKQIDSAYVKTGVVRWKMVPYVTGMFRNSREVTEAAECAADQGAFWEMHDLLFARRKEWMASANVRELLGRYAAELKLNVVAFARCGLNPAIAARVHRHDALAAQLQIRGTPTFYVNGAVVPGAVPFDVFRQVIEAAAK
jgi:protein-disulfide isomerase